MKFLQKYSGWVRVCKVKTALGEYHQWKEPQSKEAEKWRRYILKQINTWLTAWMGPFTSWSESELQTDSAGCPHRMALSEQAGEPCSSVVDQQDVCPSAVLPRLRQPCWCFCRVGDPPRSLQGCRRSPKRQRRQRKTTGFSETIPSESSLPFYK